MKNDSSICIYDAFISFLKYDDEYWYLHMINNDRCGSKLSLKDKEDVVKNSMKAAEDKYNDLITKYGNLSFNDLIKIFNIRIKYIVDDCNNDYIYFGLYDPNNRIITFNVNIFSIVKNFLIENDLQNVISIKKLEQVVLFHELFHAIEDMSTEIYTRTKMLKSKLFHFITLRRKLDIASEIGAMHFSKLMSGIKFSPYIYNVIILVARGCIDFK